MAAVDADMNKKMLSAYGTVEARLRTLGDPDHAEIVAILRRGYELMIRENQLQVKLAENLEKAIRGVMNRGAGDSPVTK